MPFKESDLSVGDWVKYKEAKGGAVWIAEVRSFYPFGREPIADTTLGHVPISTIIEVRRHVCDRNGEPTTVTDDPDGDSEITRIVRTCSVCGVPQVFERTD